MLAAIKAFLRQRIFPGLEGSENRWFPPTRSVPLGLAILNALVQRVFRINGNVPWPVHYTSQVTAAQRIEIGAQVRRSFALSGSCYIQGYNGILIGDRTLFAPGVKIISANHDPANPSAHLPCEPIRIGDDCWIGANAVILPGVVLGDGCIVGAGAVVTQSFPANSVVAGVPAKLVRYREESLTTRQAPGNHQCS